MTIESKSDFARRRKRSAGCITNWISDGLISGAALVGDGRNARINVEIAEAQLDKRMDPGQRLGNGAKGRQSGKGPTSPKPKPAVADAELAGDDDAPDGEPDYAREKARLAKAQADAQEMKNARERNEVVPVAVTMARWADHIVSARSRLLAIPARLRGALPHLSATDIGKIDAEIRRVLTDLGRAEVV